MTAETILGLIFLVFIITVMGFSFQHSMTARLAPLLVGITATLLLAAQLLREFLGRDRLKKKEIPSSTRSFKEAIPYLEFGCWMAGLLVTVYLVGIVFGLSLLLLAYLKRLGESWVLSVLLAAGTLVTIYGVFGMGLEVYLYKGILLE